MFNYIIYDFDGTISDTYPVLTEAFDQLLRNHNIINDKKTIYDQLKRSIGYAIKQYDFDCAYHEASNELHTIHDKMALEKQKAFPDAGLALKYAKENGKMNFLYTHSGKIVFDLLENMGLLPYFDFILDKSYGFPSKPAPDALNFLTEKFSIYKSRALMVGDRDIDIEAGHNAGIAGCMIDPENYYPECKAEYRIDNLKEIINIL